MHCRPLRIAALVPPDRTTLPLIGAPSIIAPVSTLPESSPQYRRSHYHRPSISAPGIIAPASAPRYRRPRIGAPVSTPRYQRRATRPTETSMVPSRLFIIAKPSIRASLPLGKRRELADEAQLIVFGGDVDFAVVVQISSAGNRGALIVAVGEEP